MLLCRLGQHQLGAAVAAAALTKNNDARRPNRGLATRQELESMTVGEIRAHIDSDARLSGISKSVGGKSGRTKQAVIDEILAESDGPHTTVVHEAAQLLCVEAHLAGIEPSAAPSTASRCTPSSDGPDSRLQPRSSDGPQAHTHRLYSGTSAQRAHMLLRRHVNRFVPVSPTNCEPTTSSPLRWSGRGCTTPRDGARPGSLFANVLLAIAAC